MEENLGNEEHKDKPVRSGFGLAERPAKTKVNYLYLQKNNHFSKFLWANSS